MKHCILVSHCLYLTAVEREAPRADHPIDQVKGTMCNSVCFYMMGVLTLSQQNGVFYWISVWVITQKIRNKVNARQLCVPSLGVPSPEDEGSSGSRSPTWKIGLIVDDWSWPMVTFFPKIKKLIITSLLNLSSFDFQPLGFAETFSNTPENPSPNLLLKQLQGFIVLVALYWDLPSTSRPLFNWGAK